MGKFLTEPVIEALRQQTHVDFNVWPINKLPNASNEREALPQLKTDDRIVLREMNKEILPAYSVMDDYADNQAILLRANTPRSITAAGLDTINVAIVGLIVAGIISLVVMAIAIQRVRRWSPDGVCKPRATDRKIERSISASGCKAE